jgi:DNA-binding transcriptional regulator/RsmH inhibitor MraZ
MGIVSVCLHIQQQSKLKTVFVIGENSAFRLWNKMQWTASSSEALSSVAPTVGIER